MDNILITGVSSGIGFELAKLFLSEKYRVWGVSRRIPEELLKDKNFHFIEIDLSDLSSIKNKFNKILCIKDLAKRFKYVFLNAGQIIRIEKMKEVPFDEIDYIMRVNVWCNKIILDFLLHKCFEINTVVFSASMAGVRARAGFNAYSLSKATLNMLGKLYALEEPDIFFAVLGICIFDSRLYRKALDTLPPDIYPEFDKLKERVKKPGYLVAPKERAKDVYDLLCSGELQKVIGSGDFVDIRTLL